MNLGEIRNLIQAHGYGTDTADVQNLLVNAIYREVLADRRWPWLTKQGTVALPAGTSTVDLSAVADLRDVDAIHIAGYDDPQYLDPEQLRAYGSPNNQSTGSPVAWTKVGTSLELYPIASVDLDVVVDYVYAPPALIGDADVPVIPAEHHDVLVYGVISRLGIRERDSNVRQLVVADYDRALQRLRTAAGFRQRQSTTQVQSSGRYDPPSPWFWMR